VICLLVVLWSGEDEPEVQGLITEVLDPFNVGTPSPKSRNRSDCGLVLTLGTSSAAAAAVDVDAEVEEEDAVVAGWDYGDWGRDSGSDFET
jgi:hypothetical protein